MSQPPRPACAPTIPHSALRQAVEDLLQQDDWGRLLLRNFYVAHVYPSYRQASTVIGVTPGTVTKRISSLHALLTHEVGECVILVSPGDRIPELTPLGRFALNLLRPAFPKYPPPR